MAFIADIALASISHFERQILRASSAETIPQLLIELNMYKIEKNNDGSWHPGFAMNKEQKEIFSRLGVTEEEAHDYAVIGTLDPTLKDIALSRDLKDSYIIRRNNMEIIIQEGKLLNREALSSGTAEGIDVAVFLASMLNEARSASFYYCDEHFSYIQSDIEKRIFGLMLEHLKNDEQLIFTTHNTDMLDLNLPKHSYIFLRKHYENGEYRISAVSASDILKRNTDSIRCTVENDVFKSLPDDSLLDMLEKEKSDEE